jgi:hypothetical protein
VPILLVTGVKGENHSAAPMRHGAKDYLLVGRPISNSLPHKLMLFARLIPPANP